MKRTVELYMVVLLVLTAACGCNKALDVPLPGGVLNTSIVFSDDVSAQSAMRGVYASMTNFLASGPWSGGMSGPLGLEADELTLPTYSAEQQQFVDNNLVPANREIAGPLWGSFYNYIYQCNKIFEGLQQSTGVTAAGKDQLMAEASFVRGLCYFYLVNLYDSVPLILTSDYRANALLPRSGPDKVYGQIIEDLQFAQEKMGELFINPGARFRPTKWSATSLLARVYQFRNNWKGAEDAATAVLSKTASYRLDSLNGVFTTVSPEAIWNLANAGSNIYTIDGPKISGNANNSAYRMTPYLLSLFQAGDQRMVKWMRVAGGVTAPLKYKTVSNTQVGAKSESTMVLRLAELYLIRAEARAQQNNLAGAIQDVDSVRIRAGARGNATQAFQTVLFSNPSIDQADLLNLIYDERLREFFSEFGLRWLDAKRLQPKNIALFFGSRKPNITATDAFFPIPDYDLKNNPFLTQNQGY